MNYKSIQQLKPRAFKRRFGVRRKTFKKMVKNLKKFPDGATGRLKIRQGGNSRQIA